MTSEKMKKFEMRAEFIKAMAHPSRLQIIDELNDGEKCVCDLHDVIDANMSTVSKHLSVLKKAGIVKVEKRGLQMWYSLRVGCVNEFLSCVDKALLSNLEADLSCCIQK